MQVAIFTEAGHRRGMGHLIRCDALAHAFKRAGCKVRFFVDSDMEWEERLGGMVRFDWHHLPDVACDIVVIDSYEAQRWHYERLAKRARIALFLDDFGRLAYPPGVVLNMAPDARQYFTSRADEGINRYLLGLRYVPIRQIFHRYKRAFKKRQVVIMLGGMDTGGLSHRVCEVLRSLPIRKVVITAQETVAERVAGFVQTDLLFRPSDRELTRVMAHAKVAITTASMSLYEFNLLQVPTIAIAVNAHQALGLTQSMRYGLAFRGLRIDQKGWQEQLCEGVEVLCQRAIKPLERIDGEGAKRVVHYLLQKVSR